MDILTIVFMSGIIFGCIGLFMGCKFSNDKLDDIVSENYDSQKENGWLREQNEKIKSENAHKITIGSNGMTITKDNSLYQYIGSIRNNVEFTHGFCDEL